MKKCYLCEQGTYKSDYVDPPMHGFAFVRVGMVDVGCPITKDEYDKLVERLSNLPEVKRP